MDTTRSKNGRFRLGDLILDRGKRQVSRGGEVLELSKLSYRLLIAFVEAAPNLLTHDELVENIWPGRVIGPETITQRIKLVRKALGDDAETPRYIGLVREEEYRWLTDVHELPKDENNVTRNLIVELGRRRVLQVGLVYAAVAWSITEVLSFLLDALPVFPQWSKTLVAIIFVVGFPVAMFLAWRFDIGLDGIKRTQAASREGRVTIISAFVLLVGATAGLFYLIYPSVVERGTEKSNARTEIASNTIAIMPFINNSGDPDDLYLSEGLGDELRDQLGRVSGLRVAARSSSVMFRDQAVDAVTIAERLRVSKLLEGTWRQTGNQLHITVQLIDGSTGFQDWTQKFDRPIMDLISIQQEIANAVVVEILPMSDDIRYASSPATLNPSAHELMLLARYHYQQVRDEPIVNLDRLLRAVGLYKQATEADPDSALAQSRYGAALLYLGRVEAAEEPIFRALTNNPDLSELQHTLGLYYWSRQDPGSGTAYKRAVELNPNNADALGDYAKWLWHVPDSDAAEQYFKRAVDIDPMSIARHAELGNFYGITGEVEEAVEVADQILARFDGVQAYMALARIYELTGDLDVAIGWALQALEKQPSYVVASWMLAELYTRIGDYEGARHFEPDAGFSPLYYQRRYKEFIDLTEELVLERPHEVQLWFGLARAYVATGQYEQAIYALRSQGLPDVVFNDSRRSHAIEATVTLADALNETGEVEQARELATWLRDHFRTFRESGAPASWWSPLYEACAHSILGDDALALQSIEQLGEAPGLPWYPILKDAACFQKFAEEPRYLAVVSSVDARMAELRERLPDTLIQFQSLQIMTP